MALPIFASILLSTVASKVVPQFAMKKLGMNPTQAALLGMAAGFGAGAYGAGVFGSAGAAAGSTAPGVLAGSASNAGAVYDAFGNLAGSSSFVPSTAYTAQTFAANVPSAITPYSQSLGGSVYGPQHAMGEIGRGFSGAQNMAPNPYIGDITPASMYDIGTPYLSPQAGASMSTPQIAHSVYNPKGWPTDGYNPAAGVGNYTSTWDKLKAYATSPDQQRYLGNAAATLIEGLMQEKPKRPMLSGGGGGGGGAMAPAYGGGGGGQVGVTWGFGGQQGGFRPQPIT
jgi:hypothetical protein